MLAKRTLLPGETSLSIRDEQESISVWHGGGSDMIPPVLALPLMVAFVGVEWCANVQEPLSAKDRDSNTEPPQAIVLAESSL